jgi:DNA-binding transcriptional regulator GbsR (MarR family)
MQELTISRGNANMSIRQLLDWGIVYKKAIAGDRKEYFIAEKDVWKWSMKIGRIRKQRELNPVLDVLREIAAGKDTPKTEAEKEFTRLHFWQRVTGTEDLISSVAAHMSLLIFILAATHYVNMVVIYYFSKSKTSSITSKSSQS